MFKSLFKFFSSEDTPKLRITHEEFGLMAFITPDFIWETEQSEIFHAIPGDENGPFKSAVEFIHSKTKEIDKYWNICKEDLKSIAHSYETIDKRLSVKELFKVTSISINSEDYSEWEVCFETKPEFKWLYIGMQFNKDELVSNDIST